MSSSRQLARVVFGGLTSNGRAPERCARMAACAQRWPGRRLDLSQGEQHWLGGHKGDGATEAATGGQDASTIGLEPQIAMDSQALTVAIRSGIAPLFYAADSSGIVFGSDATLVRAAFDSDLQIDEAGLAGLLLFDHLPPGRSLFREIRQLPPLASITGTAAGWSEPVSHADPWARQLPALGKTSPDEAAEAFLHAVRSEPTNGVPSLVPLTGGIDSRAILAAAAGTRKVETYTRGTDGDREVSAARRVAGAVKVAHRACPFPAGYLQTALPRIAHLTGGAIGLQHGHAIHPLQQFAVRGFQSVLPGTNGEFSRGFWNEDRFAGDVGSDEFWDNYFRRSMKTELAEITALLNSEWQDRVRTGLAQFQREYAAELPLNASSKSVSLDVIYLLRRVARFMMWGPYIWASAAPVELPFLDDAYVRTAAGLAPEYRRGPSVSRAVLDRTHPKLLQIPLEPSGRRIGALRPTLWQRARRKWERVRGHANGSPQHYDQWLRAEGAYVQSLVDGSVAVAEGVFKPSAIGELARAHQQGADRSKLLMKFLTIELALRVVRDGAPVTWEDA